MTTGWLNTKTKPFLLLVILLLCALIALTNGKYSLTLEELYRLFIQSPVDNPRSSTVFWQIRFPRVFAAIIIGGGLAIAGAAYQGMFRNPLVSPDILGVSAGAGVGAVLGIFRAIPRFYSAVRFHRWAHHGSRGVSDCPSSAPA